MKNKTMFLNEFHDHVTIKGDTDSDTIHGYTFLLTTWI